MHVHLALDNACSQPVAPTSRHLILLHDVWRWTYVQRVHAVGTHKLAAHTLGVYACNDQASIYNGDLL